jgi:hypothetical protein
MTILTRWTCSSLETQPVLRVGTSANSGGIDLTLIVGVWTAQDDVPTFAFRAECYVQERWQPFAGDPTVVELTVPSIDQRADSSPTEYGWQEAHRYCSDVRAVARHIARVARPIVEHRFHRSAIPPQSPMLSPHRHRGERGFGPLQRLSALTAASTRWLCLSGRNLWIGSRRGPQVVSPVRRGGGSVRTMGGSAPRI